MEAGDGGGGGQLSNPAEAAAVLAHVLALLRAGVGPASIAVISPYAAQVLVLTLTLTPTLTLTLTLTLA